MVPVPAVVNVPPLTIPLKFPSRITLAFWTPILPPLLSMVSNVQCATIDSRQDRAIACGVADDGQWYRGVVGLNCALVRQGDLLKSPAPGPVAC
jgi:hypothetical protein